MKKKILSIVFTLLVFALVFKCCGFQFGGVRVGKQNDLYRKQDYDFSKSDFSKNYFSKNNLVVVNIWATWCGPCIEEMPQLNELKEKNKHLNVDFISLSIDTDSVKLVNFNSTHKFNFKDITFQNLKYRNCILNTLEGKKGDSWIATKSVPKTYLVKNNTVIKIIDGFINKKKLQDLIDKNK